MENYKKSWKRNLVWILFVFMLVACQVGQNAKPEISQEQQVSNSPTIPNPIVTRTKSSTPTKTHTPTLTITPEPTATIVPPKSFDVSTIKTITLAVPANCPAANPNLMFDVKELVKQDDVDREGIPGEMDFDLLLRFLNDGISPDKIVSQLQKDYPNFFENYFVADITGDGIPELTFPYMTGIQIIGCKNNQYEVLTGFYFDSSLLSIYFLDVDDLNSDGLAEIAVWFDGCLGGRCPYFQIFAWNGIEFVDLTTFHCHGDLQTPYSLVLQDIDKNGTSEVIFQYRSGNIPTGLYTEYPERTETITCMWNGSQFVLADHEFGKPYYRFQAVKDGGYQLGFHNYDQALALYKQAIYDKNLEWFTDDRNLLAYWTYLQNIFPYEEPNPTSTPDLQPDPDEYQNLASFSYYKIIFIYLLQDDVQSAETTYIELEQQYPIGEGPGQFTQISKILLDTYKKTGDIHVACENVLSYANPKKDEFISLIDYYIWSPLHFIENICYY